MAQYIKEAGNNIIFCQAQKCTLYSTVKISKSKKKYKNKKHDYIFDIVFIHDY